ncbi:MAG TPA: Hsp20/alpha crystallin family protein [Micromonosporaceae bacterium]|nr:Hsp20/alpha crystallin family protein [Micromonosporaceae bacterium]
MGREWGANLHKGEMMTALGRLLAPLQANPIPIEEYEDDTSYAIRAELPGVDPVKELSVMVADGEVTIAVERVDPRRDEAHSEFRYGSFRRTVTLPRRARDETVQATYDRGILEVTAHLTRSVPIGRTVPIRLAAGTRGGRAHATGPQPARPRPR